MAAVLACGEGAALSHAAAAAYLGIRPSAATSIDVTSPTGAGRGLEGIRAHRSRLAAEEVSLVDAIPTTTCARTLLDLAETLGPEALAKAADRAEIVGLLDLADLERVLARNSGRHTLRPLHALLSSLDPQTKLTANDFERRLYEPCREAGLPLPSPTDGSDSKPGGSKRTSSGPRPASFSKPTVGRPTELAGRSSAIAPRTRSCCAPATA